MFYCAKCGELSRSGEPATRVVVETRAKEYPYREHGIRVGRGKFMRWIPDNGGTGYETVREELQHDICAKISVSQSV